MNRSILFLCLYPSKAALPAYSRCVPHLSTYLFRLLSRGLFKSTSLHNLALVSKGLTSQLQLRTGSRPILDRCSFPTIGGKSVAARGVASFPTEFPIGFAEKVQQFAFHLAELCRLQAGGDEATAVSFKDKDLLDNVITGLKKGNYEGICMGMSHLEEMLDALPMELRLHFGVACLEGLQKQRSRLQVVCSTLSAPGDMSGKSRKDLNAFRSQNIRAARDIGQCLLRILQNCMPEPCLKEFQHLTLPWAQIGFQAFLAVTFDKDAAALLTALDKVITSARMLLSGLDASFAKTEASSLLVQALHEVIVLTESEVFDTDVTFSVGECDAYTDADFSALFDYHPPCRTFVHCNWIYAIALTSTPHSRAAFGLLGELMRKLYVQGEVFEQEGERLEEIVDRFGCGRYYHKRAELKLVRFEDRNKPKPPVIVVEASFSNEDLIELFIEGCDWLGPTTGAIYCFLVDIHYEGLKKPKPFSATFYAFKRKEFPRSKTPHRNPGCRMAKDGIADGKGSIKYHVINDIPYTNDHAKTMSLADIERIFDVEVVLIRHVDERNYMEPFSVTLEYKDKDGNRKRFVVAIENFFDWVKSGWDQHFADAGKK